MNNDIITVMKINKAFGLYDIYNVSKKTLGEKWCRFMLKTGFCRQPMYTTVYNDGSKIDMYGSFFIVQDNFRTMIFNENNNTNDIIFIYVRDFVEFVLARYKHKFIN